MVLIQIWLLCGVLFLGLQMVMIGHIHLEMVQMKKSLERIADALEKEQE